MILAAIVVISIAVWFYFTALKLGENGIKWALVGIVNYYLAAIPWRFFIAKPLQEMMGRGSNEMFYNLAGLSVVVAGAALAVFARSRLLVRGRKLVDPNSGASD